MPTFNLWRTFPADMTDHELEMMTVRSIGTTSWDASIRWQRSYGFDTPAGLEGFCVFEAANGSEMARIQMMCAVPFLEVREVVEALGANAGPGPDEPAPGRSLFLVERTFAPGHAQEDVVTANRAAESADVAWVRSFWHERSAASRCIFEAPSEAALAEALSPSPATVVRAVLVSTNHPANWADTYDRMGLRRHWEPTEEGIDADVRNLARV